MALLKIGTIKFFTVIGTQPILYSVFWLGPVILLAGVFFYVTGKVMQVMQNKDVPFNNDEASAVAG